MTLDPEPPDVDPLLRKRLHARALFEKRLRAARADPLAFVELCVRDDAGRRLRAEPFQAQWIRHVQYCWARGLRSIVLAPWGHGKTSTLSLPILAWELGRNPNLRIKIIAQDQSNARKRAAGIRKIIESPMYRIVFPAAQKGAKWGEDEFTLVRPGNAIDPSVQARGVLATGIGGRADVMLYDDVVDLRNSLDPGQRAKILQFIEEVWLSRLEPDGRVLYVATRWHAADATALLSQRTGWATLQHAIADDFGGIEQTVTGVPNLADYPQVSPPPPDEQAA